MPDHPVDIVFSGINPEQSCNRGERNVNKLAQFTRSKYSGFFVFIISLPEIPLYISLCQFCGSKKAQKHLPSRKGSDDQLLGN